MSNLELIQRVISELNQKIIGQEKLVDRLLITLLADGHLLVEGAPGLAKTKAIKTLANAIEGAFHRIQFTPDLLPADITGTDIYRVEESKFSFEPGPIFNHFVLADEINRAPAKVQSALLEAMGERQVSVGRKTHKLPLLFLVMATQNPIEQEGTYPLPEAQLDRFLMKVCISYPQREAEKKILHLARLEAETGKSAAFTSSKMSQDVIFAARKETLNLHMNDAVEEYIVQLILATREPERYNGTLKNQIQYGVSPRGTIALDRCARVQAWLKGRDFVTPEDVQEVIFDVLRHRIGLQFEAEARGITPDEVIHQIVQVVPAP